MRNEISSKELATYAKAASKRAVERARALGIAVVSREGENVVKRHPNGHVEQLGTFPHAYSKLPRKRYKLS